MSPFFHDTGDLTVSIGPPSILLELKRGFVAPRYFAIVQQRTLRRGNHRDWRATWSNTVADARVRGGLSLALAQAMERATERLA